MGIEAVWGKELPKHMTWDPSTPHQHCLLLSSHEMPQHGETAEMAGGHRPHFIRPLIARWVGAALRWSVSQGEGSFQERPGLLQ